MFSLRFHVFLLLFEWSLLKHFVSGNARLLALLLKVGADKFQETSRGRNVWETWAGPGDGSDWLTDRRQSLALDFRRPLWLVCEDLGDLKRN